jgi:hypothetical protein
MKQILLFSLLFIVLASCARRRTMERVQQYGIKTVAILPIDLTVAVIKPTKISPEVSRERIERNRKFMYQALYIDLVQFGDIRLRKYSNVEFQSIDRTRNLLKEKGISDSAAQEMDGAELAKMLGVDAVIKTKITQNRIMSDEAALGVDEWCNPQHRRLSSLANRCCPHQRYLCKLCIAQKRVCGMEYKI